MAVAKYRSQGLGAWETYTKGSYRQFMARGGLLFAAKGLKPKGVQHARRPKHTGKVSLGNIVTNLSKIPGMGPFVSALKGPEAAYNRLTSEQELLAGMDSNPASILRADMPYLSPTLVAGESIGPGVLVPHAERDLQHALQGGETPGLALQGQLLQWIGGLDDHRLLNALDIGVLAKDFGPGMPHLKVGQGVYGSQVGVMEAAKSMQEVIARTLHSTILRAQANIKARRARMRAIRKVLAKTLARARSIKAQLGLLTTAGLHRKLTAAEARQITAQQRRDAQGQDQALAEAIHSERQLPKYEQSQSLISHWEGERGHLAAYMRGLSGSGAEGVSSAREALRKHELQGELTPLSETLSLLGGSSTKVGTGGFFGQTASQVSSLESGVSTMHGKYLEATQTTIPQLALNIGQLKESLAEAAESLAPTSTSATAAAPGAEEQAALQKTINEQLSQQLAVSQAQYKVLTQIPYVGKFHQGGVIPGPLGAERMALVKAGETVTPIGGQPPHVGVYVDDAMGWLKPYIRTQIDQRTREMGRNVGRPLPSRGGGQLG